MAALPTAAADDTTEYLGSCTTTDYSLDDPEAGTGAYPVTGGTPPTWGHVTIIVNAEVLPGVVWLTADFEFDISKCQPPPVGE